MKLNKGDTVYYNGYTTFHPLKITRVTKTQAIIEQERKFDIRLKREYDGNYIDIVNWKYFSRVAIHPDTPETHKLYAEWQAEQSRLSLIAVIKKFDYHNVSLEKLRTIKEILECPEK